LLKSHVLKKLGILQAKERRGALYQNMSGQNEHLMGWQKLAMPFGSIVAKVHSKPSSPNMTTCCQFTPEAARAVEQLAETG